MVVSDTANWVVEQNADSPTPTEPCRVQASALAPNMEALTTRIVLPIRFDPSGEVAAEQTATVTVSWLPRNSSTREAVVNTLILTKTR